MSYAGVVAKLPSSTDGGHSSMCAAKGCPNAWTAETANGRLCSAHAWVEPPEWPEITQAQLWAETDRARDNGAQDQPRSGGMLSPDVLADLSTRLRELQRHFTGQGEQNPKAWAHALQAREASGEHLSITQREMWRAVLGRVGSDPGLGA